MRTIPLNIHCSYAIGFFKQYFNIKDAVSYKFARNYNINNSLKESYSNTLPIHSASYCC